MLTIKRDGKVYNLVENEVNRVDKSLIDLFADDNLFSQLKLSFSIILDGHDFFNINYGDLGSPEIKLQEGYSFATLLKKDEDYVISYLSENDVVGEFIMSVQDCSLDSYIKLIKDITNDIRKSNASEKLILLVETADTFLLNELNKQEEVFVYGILQ